MSLATAMQVTREDLNPCTVQLTVECTPEQVHAAFDKAIRKFGKEMRLPGFRPGKAPASVVEKMLDENELRGEAAELAVNQALRDAIKQEDLQVQGTPHVTLEEFERDPGQLKFVAKVPLPSKVSLTDLTELKVEHPSMAVTDEEVEQQIEVLRRRAGKREKVTDRALQPGDMAVVNIEPEGGESKVFMVVAGQTFAELDAVLEGMNPEDIKAATLTFPEGFQEADWSGKTLACQVTLRSISSTQIPDLDDEFAKSLSAESVENLRERVKEMVQQNKTAAIQDMIHEQLLDQIAERSEIHFADTMWESVVERRLNEMRQDLQRQGSTLEKHAEEQGMSPEEFNAALQKEAKQHVQRAVVVEHIFREQKMQVTNQEAQYIFLEIARENGIKPEGLQQFQQEYGAAIREEIMFRAMYRHVMDYLRETATVVETDA